MPALYRRICSIVSGVSSIDHVFFLAATQKLSATTLTCWGALVEQPAIAQDAMPTAASARIDRRAIGSPPYLVRSRHDAERLHAAIIAALVGEIGSTDASPSATLLAVPVALAVTVAATDCAPTALPAS